MFNVFTQMPLGNVSRGYLFPDEEKAKKAFDSMVAQVRAWPKFTLDIVQHEDGIETRREHIDNA